MNDKEAIAKISKYRAKTKSPLPSAPRRVMVKYLRLYCFGLLTLLVLTLLILGIGVLVYLQEINEYDYSRMTFDYKTDLSSLVPFDPSFAKDYNIFLDGHSHTTHSDGKLSPAQLLDWAIGSGYNAIFVTDHNTIAGGLAAYDLSLTDKYANKIVVIPGQEYTCCRIHMNLINIDKTVPPCGEGRPIDESCPSPSNEQLKQIVDTVHNMGGWVIVNHIPWSNRYLEYRDVAVLPDHPNYDDLLRIGVDGIEVVNGDTFDLKSYQWAVQNKLAIVTGSDIHVPGPAYAWTIMKSDNFTRKGVWKAFTSKKTSFLLNSTGTLFPTLSAPSKTLKYLSLSPLIALGQYAKIFYLQSNGMYSFQASFCQDPIFKFYWTPFLFFLLFFLLLYTAAFLILTCTKALFVLLSNKIRKIKLFYICLQISGKDWTRFLPGLVLSRYECSDVLIGLSKKILTNLRTVSSYGLLY